MEEVHTFQISLYVILTTVLWGMYCQHPHFMKEEAEAWNSTETRQGSTAA